MWGSLPSVRCHAYVIPSEVYREIEPQILEQVREAEREQLMYLVGEHDLDIEMLSGEWRVLFAALPDFFQKVDVDARTARMAVSPDELAELTELLNSERGEATWHPIAFGLAELVDALPVGMDLVGVVFIEESDDWMWSEQTYEIQAIHPKVWDLIAPHARTLLEAGDHAALARLCSDHCECAVEFSPERWSVLMQLTEQRVPELLPIIDQGFSLPADYTGIREAIRLVSDPEHQPSLDAWLRVHADAAEYALYFRDVARERE